MRSRSSENDTDTSRAAAGEHRAVRVPWLEVMAAQFYLAVIIAQIVGLKLAQAAGLGGGDGA